MQGNSTPSDDEGLREELREVVGLAMYNFKYHDYIKTVPTIPRGKYPSERAIAELDSVMDDLMALISQKITEARIYELEKASLYMNANFNQSEKIMRRIELLTTKQDTKEEG
jgi:hypothetical protein